MGSRTSSTDSTRPALSGAWMRVPLALVWMAALVGCASAQAPATAQGPTSVETDQATSERAVIAQLDAVYERFSQGYATLAPDLVADLYTEDALYLSPRGDIKRGRVAIAAGFTRMFEGAREKGDTLRIAFDRIQRAISGHMAYEVGYYTLVRTSADGQQKTSRGKFAVVLMRGADGVWRFQVDGYSSAPPLPNTAPPPAEVP